MIRIKTPRQIEGIRRASAILIEVLDVLEAAVVPGVTTLALDAIARREVARHGARAAFLGYEGFPGAICASVNDAVIHGIPDDRPLETGDVVSIDFGVEIDGLYSDSAVTVAVGQVTPDIARLLEVTQASLEAGISAAVVGNRVRDISRAIWGVIAPHGYGVVREWAGHGVGLAIHEEPHVPNYVGRGANPRLKPGMVIAIEPMVNLGTDDVEILDDDWTVVTADGGVSAHFEHTVAILSDRTEVLTRRATQPLHS